MDADANGAAIWAREAREERAGLCGSGLRRQGPPPSFAALLENPANARNAINGKVSSLGIEYEEVAPARRELSAQFKNKVVSPKQGAPFLRRRERHVEALWAWRIVLPDELNHELEEPRFKKLVHHTALNGGDIDVIRLLTFRFFREVPVSC